MSRSLGKNTMLRFVKKENPAFPREVDCPSYLRENE